MAELERSPELLDHIDYLKALVADELTRRKKFVDDLARDKIVEFINGQIVRHPPAQGREFEVVLHTASLLTGFVTQRDSGAVYRKNCLVRCQRNDYMPDVCFFSDSKCAGFDDDTRIYPPPDLAVEVLSSFSEGSDRKLKLQDYARHGVGEYWIIDPDGRMIEQYVLPSGASDYWLKARLPEGGRLTSTVVTGFGVPAAAFFDARENLRSLRELSGAD